MPTTHYIQTVPHLLFYCVVLYCVSFARFLSFSVSP
jgi:hypothetical protein